MKFTHTSKSVWNISYFRPFCMALIPEEIVIVWIANSLICLKTFCIKKIKFLMSTHNLGFHILGFYHRVQWRGAKTAGKDCWGPCHGLIPSSWDLAQNCSLKCLHLSTFLRPILGIICHEPRVDVEHVL